MQAYQTWQNTISHIKLGLGADTMKLEFDDDRIVEIIEEHVIPLYSKFDKHRVYYAFDDRHIVDPTSLVKTYEFDESFEHKIMDIEGKIDGNSLFDDYNVSQFAMSAGDITDYLALKNYQHAYELIQPVDDWKFMPPNRIMVIEGNSIRASNGGIGNGFIAAINVVHPSPLTMNPTFYDYFKELALAKIMISIGKIRSKFEDFSAPTGQIRINGEKMVTDGETLWKDVMEDIKNTPPDVYAYFF